MTAISEGFVDDNPSISSLMRYKDSLYILDGVRVVVPSSLRPSILEGLHSAHQGVSAMELRAQAIVFWPGITNDIQSTRTKCRECNRNAPSQAPLPTEPAFPPCTPFEKIFTDFFEFSGHHNLIVGDRLSGWSEIFSTPSGSPHSGARGLIACLRSFFTSFGVPEELSSDRGPEFTASATGEFLQHWGVRHRLSSAYHPQSNGCAEVAVKSAKRLLRCNVGPTGTLNNDRQLHAMLQLRNTPNPDCNVSPAQIIFGCPIRDVFSFTNRLEKFSNPSINPLWREAWALKEAALRTRYTRTAETLNEHVKALPPLSPGDRCFEQNQTGNAPKKWDRTGLVTEVLDHNQYIVKIDGSGRVTRRNRRFLRAFKPATTATERAPPRPHPPFNRRHQIPLHISHPPSPIATHVASDVTQEGTPCPPSAPFPETVIPDPSSSSSTMSEAPTTPVVPEVTTPTGQEAAPSRTHRALQHLMPHNKPGLKETVTPQRRRKPLERP
ncbi:uncharacterized protein LOC106012147 [Aplysia californica]|uniref:Uncharacterized protein LOC106012147 n=1 Tax=Aplysia californica TaxID=6500 RepID=A0ABM1A2M9_APLCA|nr:uncharacterized protein LOC106012147 [Aplysia californica]